MGPRPLLYLYLPALFFEPGPFPELPGPAVGPKGPKIGQKSGAGFIFLSSPRFAQDTLWATLCSLIPLGCCGCAPLDPLLQAAVNIAIHVAALSVAMNISFLKDRKSVILGVWAAPGAPILLVWGSGRVQQEQLRLPSFSSYSMLRNRTSGKEIGLPGRILAGLLPGKHRNRP